MVEGKKCVNNAISLAEETHKVFTASSFQATYFCVIHVLLAEFYCKNKSCLRRNKSIRSFDFSSDAVDSLMSSEEVMLYAEVWRAFENHIRQNVF